MDRSLGEDTIEGIEGVNKNREISLCKNYGNNIGHEILPLTASDRNRSESWKEDGTFA